MSYIIIPSRRTRQPQGAVRVVGSALAAWAPYVGKSKDVIASVTSSSGTIAAGRDGLAILAPRNTILSPRASANGYSIVVIVDGSATLSENWIGCDGGGVRVWQMRGTTDRACEFISFNEAGSAFTTASPAPPGTTASDTIVYIASVGLGIAKCWAGKLGGPVVAASDTTLTTPKLLTAGKEIWIGSRDGVSNGFSGKMYGYVIYDGPVTDAFARGIVVNPWQIFAPDVRRIYFGASGGATTTDAAIAGTQATDVAAITAEATTGAAIAGTQATDVAAVTVEATTGAAIAGTQITDVAAVTVEATTGAALAGTQASDVAAVNVTASTGTGTDADMAGVQASDVAAITAEATLGLAIAATQASDAGYIVVEATLPASMAATQASDVAAITIGAVSIWTDVGVSAATWSDVGGATSIWTDL